MISLSPSERGKMVILLQEREDFEKLALGQFLGSKSEGILSSVVAEEFRFNFKISIAQLDFSQNFLKKKTVKRTAASRCSLIAFRLIFF